MGFYIEMKEFPLGHATEFREGEIPPVFWTLYVVAGFALGCMLLAAHAGLALLSEHGNVWDRLLVASIWAVLPLYLLVGAKLIWVRKFVDVGKDLRTGFRFAGWTFWQRRWAKEAIRTIELVQRIPTANLAPREHDDPQYFIRGHWRVVLVLNSGKSITLDKHTEREVIEPLYERLRLMMGN